jgi:hypothetical protein
MTEIARSRYDSSSGSISQRHGSADPNKSELAYAQSADHGSGMLQFEKRLKSVNKTFRRK